MEENKTDSTEKPVEEVKPIETKCSCCEGVPERKTLGISKKKRRLFFVSALAALLAAVALFVSSFIIYFSPYADGTALTIGIFSATFTLAEALGLGTFGFLSLLHLLNGKHDPKLLFPVTAIALGGGEFLGDLLLLASQAYLQMAPSIFAEIFLLMLLGGALVALGILVIFAPAVLEKLGQIFVLLPYGVTLIYLAIRLVLLLIGCTVTTIPLSPALFENLACGLIEIIGLVLLLGDGAKTLKEDKESAETLLAYHSLLEKGVITEEEFESEKEKLLS